MNEEHTYTAQDFKKNIETMESEGLPLDAPVEVEIDGKTYHIKGLGHFHVIPNMTILLELKIGD